MKIRETSEVNISNINELKNNPSFNQIKQKITLSWYVSLSNSKTPKDTALRFRLIAWVLVTDLADSPAVFTFLGFQALALIVNYVLSPFPKRNVKKSKPLGEITITV